VLNLRVLITTYHQAYLTRGGGEYELQSIADGLRQLGVIADVYGPYSRSVDFYDVVLHFSVHPGGLDLLREIAARGKPVVLWPNLWPSGLSSEAMRVIQDHVALARFVAFKSRAERDRLLAQVSMPADKVATCKWIADLSYLKPAPEALFPSLYNVRDYALWFGIVEPVKNQLAAIRVLRRLGIPLVLVGRYRDAAYYRECANAGGDSVLFLDGLPQKSEIVRSALQEASFYVELALEPPGLSAIEAGLSGCRLLLSDSDWAREHFGDHAIFVDPTSDAAIAEGVGRVLERPVQDEVLQRHLMEYCFPNAIMPLVDLLDRATR
jgi:glycosyltransferase involved in cell wall biosynthesis